MPTKILVPLLDTFVNPSRIGHINRNRKTKNNNHFQNQTKFSKSASQGAKAMALAAIKIPADDTTLKFDNVSSKVDEIKAQGKEILEKASYIQQLGDKVHSDLKHKKTYGEIMETIRIAKENGFKQIIDNDTVIEFECTEKRMDSPEKIVAQEYKNGKLVRKSSLVNNSILTIEEYEGSDFQQSIFSDGKLYKYAYGTKKQDKDVILEEFYFEMDGNSVLRYSKNKVHDNYDNKTTIEEYYKFGSNKELIKYQSGIENNSNNYPVKIKSSYSFKNGELNFALLDIYKSKNLIKESYINRGVGISDFYIDFENPYNFDYSDLDLTEEYNDTSIKEKYSIMELDDGRYMPVSYIADYLVQDGNILSSEKQNFYDKYSRAYC